jgi:hypothetical protein
MPGSVVLSAAISFDLISDWIQIKGIRALRNYFTSQKFSYRYFEHVGKC